MISIDATRLLFRGLLEISQIRRSLIFLRRHQEAFCAEVIVLRTDANMVVAFGANILAPPDRLVGRHPTIGLHDNPGRRHVCKLPQAVIGRIEIPNAAASAPSDSEQFRSSLRT